MGHDEPDLIHNDGVWKMNGRMAFWVWLLTYIMKL